MRVLILHNLYQLRGGEDAVVDMEANLLRQAGHEVSVRTISNDQIKSLRDRVLAFQNVAYDPERAKWIKGELGETGAEILHVHNFFPLLTPGVHSGAAEMGIPVVQTLHNYRLICANSLLLRNGQICEKCVGGSNLPALVHRCYRHSLPGSLAVVRMQNRMRAAGNVHRYVALTEFARVKFIAGGLPADRLVVKPNFGPAQEEPHPAPGRENRALFVGRISAEKGLDVLLRAWASIPDIPLLVAGDGPEFHRLAGMKLPNVHMLGQLPQADVKNLIARSKLLIVPSLWYEGFPMVVVEAFAAGTPVVASRLGSLAEIVEDGVTGLHFTPGDAKDLAAKVAGLMKDEARRADMGERARAVFEARYTSRQNLVQLEAIYREAREVAERESRMAG
jgi:glycosyltransferase involved in cell wall biosynthesis